MTYGFVVLLVYAFLLTALVFRNRSQKHTLTPSRPESGQEIESDQEILRVLVNTTSNVIFVKDEEGKYLYVNSRFEELFHLKTAQIFGRTDLEIFPEDVAIALRMNDATVLRTKTTIEVEEMVPQSGATHTYLSTKFPLHLKNSNRTVLGGVATDITVVKDYQRRLEEVNLFLDSIIENIPSMIFIKDAENLSFRKVNRAAEDVLGFSRLELLGKNDFDFFPSDQAKFFTDHDRNVLNVEKFIDIPEELVQTKSMGTRVLHTKKLSLDDNLGRPQFLIGISEDITERMQAQKVLESFSRELQAEVTRQTEEVRRHSAELERSNHELKQFAYAASHDLKSPLRAIHNYASWITEDLGEGVPATSKRYLTLLQSRIQRMDNLLDDLLLYSKAGTTQLDIVPVQLSALVKETIDFLNFPDSFTVASEVEAITVNTHKVPLEQCLRNLIGNAIKHHDRRDGNVTVSSEVDDKMIVFSVRDDGTGIAREHHSRIFEMFATLRPRDEVEGSGMGLALVKKTAEGLGGSVTVESEPGKGSCFRLSWPYYNE